MIVVIAIKIVAKMAGILATEAVIAGIEKAAEKAIEAIKKEGK